jgi:hypothetical protein
VTAAAAVMMQRLIWLLQSLLHKKDLLAQRKEAENQNFGKPGNEQQ